MLVDESFADLTIAPEDLEATGPGISLDGATIPEGIPEEWEKILRHNPRVRRVWEDPGSYPSASEAANAIAWYAGAYGLTKEQTTAVLVAFYAVPGRKPLHRAKLELTLRTWAKGHERLEAWQRSHGNGHPPELDPTDPGPWAQEPSRPATETPTAPAAGAAPFTLLPAPAFLARHYGGGAAVVPEWGWRETGILVDARHGGSGKSLFFLQAALELARGEAIAGRFKVGRPHRVGLFLLEDPEDETQTRLRRILQGKGLNQPPESLLIFERFPLEFGGFKGRVNEEAFARLRATLKTHRLTVAMFDPLAYLHTGEENSNSEMLRWLRRLADTCRACGTAIALAHHVTWELGGDMHARGASAIGNWADTVLKGRRLGDGEPLKVKLECEKINFAPRFKPVVLEADANLVLTARSEVDAVCPPEELVRFLREDLGGTFPGNKVDFYALASKRFSCSDKPVREATAAAERAGLIRDLGRGRGFEATGGGKQGEIGNW